MLFFLSIIICAALIAAFVVGLRRYHQRAFNLAAEREQNLPPLADPALDIEQLLDDAQLDPAAEIQPSANKEPSANEEPSTCEEPSANEEPSACEEPSANKAPSTLLPPTSASPAGDWKQRAMEWRELGDYEQALACCGEAWPQWQSYQQAAIVMRAAIKTAPTEEVRKDWYDRLYHLAVQASLLHDRVKGLPDLTRQDMIAKFSRADIDALGIPWQNVGCDQLRLLTKSDRKRLTALYGSPDSHQSAKVWFQHLL